MEEQQLGRVDVVAAIDDVGNRILMVELSASMICVGWSKSVVGECFLCVLLCLWLPCAMSTYPETVSTAGEKICAKCPYRKSRSS